MDKKHLVILIVIALLCAAAALAFIFSGERLEKRIRRDSITAVIITYRRESHTFTESSDINRFCTTAVNIKLSRIPEKGAFLNNKSGENFFITFKYMDCSALDLCFNSGFSACQIGGRDWYRVINPDEAALLERDLSFAAKK